MCSFSYWERNITSKSLINTNVNSPLFANLNNFSICSSILNNLIHSLIYFLKLKGNPFMVIPINTGYNFKFGQNILVLTSLLLEEDIIQLPKTVETFLLWCVWNNSILYGLKGNSGNKRQISNTWINEADH